MKDYKSIRVFQNPLLESLTHVHPVTPLVVWLPIVVFLHFKSAQLVKDPLTIIGLSVAGLLTWTLIEYLLHRYVFHFPANSKISKRFVFLFHGLHHDDPQDPTRLVMPPVPAVLIASIFFLSFRLIIGEIYIYQFFAWFMIGYLCYDYIHYATHHFPMKSKVGKYLKKHHIMHHNVCHDKKYGVSSPLWDIILNTYKSDKRK